MSRKTAFKVLLVAAAILILAGLGIEAAFCQTYQGTDEQTGLNTQENTWERDSRIADLRAEMEAMLSNTNPADNASIYRIMGSMFEYLVARMNEPATTAPAANAAGQGQANAAANAAGDVARDQAITAIDYASRFLKNFTSEKGNKWNTLRDTIFVPIALLLILPGAVLTQVKSLVSQGSPVITQCNPFEGIQRSIIAIFLIPGSYLIVNYSIDFANSIQFTIATEYNRLFGSNMYKDAICAEIRAFGVRYISENDGSLQTPPADLSSSSNGEFSAAEGRLWGKLVDPCSGLNRVPANRDDASMPASSIAARLMMNTSNAGINTTWAILCAFQMAFFYYLYFVGPIMAALWVWPMKQLRDAFPSWVEGVVTLCFWSLFWHTTILLMACFKGTDETGLFVMSALNFLATAAVKHAFDFAGLVRAAGQKASELIEKAGKEGGGGGGGSGGGSQGQDYLADPTGAANTRFVSQETVSAYQGHGSASRYRDENGDGRVDGIWDSQKGNYAPPPPGESLFLINATSSPDLVIPENIEMPPMAEGAPPAMVTQDDFLAFFNPATNQYEVQQVLNPLTGEMVPQYIVDEAGRIAIFDGDAYTVPQTQVAEQKFDTYRMNNGVLEIYNATAGAYTPLQGGTEAPVVPPIAEPATVEHYRNSLHTVMAESYFSIMHYPTWKPTQAIEVEQEREKAESLETPVSTSDFRPMKENAPVPEMEPVTNMINKDNKFNLPESKMVDRQDFAVPPPPLFTSSPVEPPYVAGSNTKTNHSSNQMQPIVSLEKEIRKLFERLGESADNDVTELFVTHSSQTPVQTIAPRSAEELLCVKNNQQNSALNRALGKGFVQTGTENPTSIEGLW